MNEQTRHVVDSDPETGTYRATYAYPVEPPSIAAIHALSEVTESGVTDFDPLYHVAGVDPDALDELFRPPAGDATKDCRVTFRYADYEVTVKSHGRIVIRASRG